MSFIHNLFFNENNKTYFSTVHEDSKEEYKIFSWILIVHERFSEYSNWETIPESVNAIYSVSPLSLYCNEIWNLY